MKAILLAAGEGKRLRPLTDNCPKCLVKLRGKPLLEYQLATFQRCGVTDIVIVTGYKQEALQPYQLRSYHNDQYSTTNMVHSLFCAEAEFNEDVIISYTDILFEPRVLQALLNAEADFAVTIDKGWQNLWQFRMDDPLTDAETLKVDDADFITEIGKKASSYREIQGQYIGLFKISRRVLGQVSQFYRQLNQKASYDGKDYSNMYMTSFIHRIANDLIRVKAIYIQNGWLEVDTLEDKQRYEAMNISHADLFDFRVVCQTD
jgi:choline kinase